MQLEQENKQHVADVIKGLWEALISPSWDPNTLKTMGLLIYNRTSIKDVPRHQFDLLFPRLVEVAGALDTRFEIKAKATENPIAPACESPNQDKT